jgi:hypothetical protein
MIERVAAFARWKRERGESRRRALGIAELHAYDKGLAPSGARQERPVGEKAAGSGSQRQQAARTHTLA